MLTPCPRRPLLPDFFRPCGPMRTRHIIWSSCNGAAIVEPDGVPDTLTALHAELGRVLAEHGTALEARPWRPHLALARKARDSA